LLIVRSGDATDCAKRRFQRHTRDFLQLGSFLLINK
jgi:hypothetical protein